MSFLYASESKHGVVVDCMTMCIIYFCSFYLQGDMRWKEKSPSRETGVSATRPRVLIVINPICDTSNCCLVCSIRPIYCTSLHARTTTTRFEHTPNKPGKLHCAYTRLLLFTHLMNKERPTQVRREMRSEPRLSVFKLRSL